MKASASVVNLSLTHPQIQRLQNACGSPEIDQPGGAAGDFRAARSEEHTSELQSRQYIVCPLLLEKKTPITRCCPASSRCSMATVPTSSSRTSTSPTPPRTSTDRTARTLSTPTATRTRAWPESTHH